jgi:hypothetical protein
MKNFTKLFLASIIFITSANFSLAASYPSTCPSGAQAIITAVGGCSAINSTQYKAIYSKCCYVSQIKTTQATASNNKVITTTNQTSQTETTQTTGPVTSFLIGISILLLIIFWIWMIIDVARRNIPLSSKILWLLVVIILNWLGALIYYFVVRQPMIKKEKQI